MADLKILWEDSALTLLDARDRYTRSAIREQFRRDPQKGAIEIDPARQCFITPVSNSRFSVVWNLNSDENEAVVQAVIPLANVHTMSRDDLQKSVTKAIASESKVLL